MPGKEEFSTHISHEKRTYHTTKGQKGSKTVVRRQKTGRNEGKVLARACIGVSTGKTRQDRVNSLGLASLNRSSGLWGIEMAPRCLVLGPGMI